MFDLIDPEAFREECRQENILGRQQRELSKLPLEIKLAVRQGYRSIQKSYIIPISDSDLIKLDEMGIESEIQYENDYSPRVHYIFSFDKLAEL